MVTRLFLIRHGETEDADVRRYKGHIDVPLSENGIRQMERLEKYIVQDCSNSTNSLNGLTGLSCLNAVYCSDLGRAVKSAEIIARPHGIKPSVVETLRERNFGKWEGMSFEEIRAQYPEEFEAWAKDPLRFSPVEGESTIEVRDRAIRALDEILNNHRKRSGMVQDSSKSVNMVQSSSRLNTIKPLNSIEQLSIAIVSHGGINRIVLCHLLGTPLDNIFRIEQDFGALNIIEFHDKYPVVKLINHTL